MRKQLLKDEALDLFKQRFDGRLLAVEESHQTYYDTLGVHLNWWVRIEGQFLDIPAHQRLRCDREVKRAIKTLATEDGIPYTVHLLRVRLRCP